MVCFRGTCGWRPHCRCLPTGSSAEASKRSKRIRAATALTLRLPALELSPRARGVTLRALAIALLYALCPACSPAGEPLRSDTTRYLQLMEQWAPAQAEAARSIDRILASHFVDESEVRHQIDELQERVSSHLARARAYEPATLAVKRVHSRYLFAWEQLSSGCTSVIHGFDLGDTAAIASGRKAIELWVQVLPEIARELRALAAEAGAPPPARANG